MHTDLPDVSSDRQRLRQAFAMACAAVLVVLLFVLGAQPFAAGLVPEPWDKLAHFLFFGFLAFLVWLARNGNGPVWVVLIVAAIGAADELHQRDLPGRSADLMDFLTDVLAATCMVIMMSYLRRRRRKQRDNGQPPVKQPAGVSSDS